MAEPGGVATEPPEPAGTPSALQLRSGMTFSAWVTMGRRLSRITNASPWWLGDWLVYGRHSYGERYKAALDITGLDYQTLRNYAWVARRFDVSRRRDTLSFQHHAEVAALPEPDQDLWLHRADTLRWSKTELRRRLSARRADARHGGSELVSVSVRVSPQREQRWRKAAAVAGVPPADWLAAAGDAMADAALGEHQHAAWEARAS